MQPTGHWSRVQVMCVDDNTHMLQILKAMLHTLGVRDVHTALDAAAAFKELRYSSPDLIITDWLMQPLDGLDFVRVIRTGSDVRNHRVPIIMLTGYAEHHLVIEAREAGVDDFLAKPISLGCLEGRLRRWLPHVP